jgi:hypothetical protein
MEPGTLDRWIEQNEALYDRRNVRHWHHLSWDNAEYRDRNLAGGESRELPEQVLAAYRSVVLRDLKGIESPPPGQERPEGTTDLPGPDPRMNKQEDTTQVCSPDVPAGRSTSQAGGRTEPLQSQERNQREASEPHGSTGNEAAGYWQSTLGLLHREYAVTLSRMEQLNLENQKPHSVEHAGHMLQEWRYYEGTLAGLREHLRWYSMFEASPLHLCTSVAHGIAPAAPVLGRSIAGGLGLGAPPGAALGTNFASFGAHLGYQFGAPVNSARK